MFEKIIGRGAEAILIQKGNFLEKYRIKKRYRLQVLDEKLRKSRTKKEAKLLEKACFLISVPKVISSDNKEKIIMEFIKGKKLSEHLDKLENAGEVCKRIGENIAKLHDSDIIHGDLTTSNMILVENSEKPTELKPNKKDINITNNLSNKITQNKRARGESIKRTGLVGEKAYGEAISSEAKPSEKSESSFKVYFIDFGLGFHSERIEDKAVDLHLLKQALEAKHFVNWQNLFSAVLRGYNSKDKSRILEQLKKVESRGRYKKGF